MPLIALWSPGKSVSGIVSGLVHLLLVVIVYSPIKAGAAGGTRTPRDAITLATMRGGRLLRPRGTNRAGPREEEHKVADGGARDALGILPRHVTGGE